ncbi:MAG: PAS domain S-box protein [Anaerolineae bacterium]|nr:PAS domain S-box protein [Anaerolineae bacterium]
MTRQAPKVPYLAALLSQHQDDIASTWAEMAHSLPGTRYAEQPVAELRSCLLRGVAAAVETLSTGSYEATEAHLRDMSSTRSQMDFDISEVTEVLLLLKEAALPAIQQAYRADPVKIDKALTALEIYLRFAVSRLGHLYAEALEKELAESEERFRTLANFTYDWEYWLDPNRNYVYVSPSCERITGYRSDEFRKSPELLEAIVHPGDREIVTEHLREEPIEGSMVHPIEFRIITRSGEERWLEHVCQPVYGSTGNYLGRRGSNRDITERKRAEDALAEQVKEKAITTERSRLARELHDSVTQALYSVTLYAEAARLALSAEKQDIAAENLRELHNMAREAMVDMRMLIFELHPPELEEEGLVAALQARLAAVESRARLRTEIYVEGERHLPISVAEELFRIALEALNNVIKHANARQVTVALKFHDRGVCLEITDDGVGFDPVVAKASGGRGLRGIEERVQRIQGTFAVESAPGEGTTLRVTGQDTGIGGLDS